jgi:DNA-binding transcriptional ArsR family regulator
MVGAEVDEPIPVDITLTGVLHALSDPTRLAVLSQLDRGGETLCGRLDVRVAKSTLSQHLRVLREAGVTRTRPIGTQRWLSVRRDDLDQLFPGLLDVVLAASANRVDQPGRAEPADRTDRAEQTDRVDPAAAGGEADSAGETQDTVAAASPA